MKKCSAISVLLFSIILSTFLCSCTQAASETSEKKNTSSSVSVSSSSDGKQSESTVSGNKNESFYGYAFIRPSNFDHEFYSKKSLDYYYGKVSTDSDVYLFLYQKELEDKKDLPSGFKTDIDEFIEKIYKSMSDNIKYSDETKENVKLLGKDFVRQTGMIDTGFNNSDGKASKLYYTAYYGCMDFPYYAYKDQPMVIMSFSEGTDDQIMNDVKKIADQAYSSFKESI